MNVSGEPEKRFVVDVMLGKLARWLRVLGFDARTQHLQNRSQVESLVAGGLIPVTRKESLREVPGVVFIENDAGFEQVKELVSRLHISKREFRLFTRCNVCNAELDLIRREEAFGSVPDFVFETAADFRKCPKCGRVYWAGSHRGRMLDKLESLGEWDSREEEID